MTAKYRLKVTAGPTYDKQQPVQVNSSEATKISTEDIDAAIHVRIVGYHDQPESASTTSPYFSHPSRTKDRFSISFAFATKSTILGNDLVFGNDFDHSIKDKLPPLFNTAFNYVTKFIDPGLYGDPYADEPYLYGPLLSSINILEVGNKNGLEKKAKEMGEMSTESGKTKVLEEGADGEEAEKIRHDKGLPSTGPARMKYFLQESHKKDFEFEEGRVYACDFFNPYLDFSEFAVKLPYGIGSISALSFWDGQALRYVLRNRKTKTLLFVISFTLVPIQSGESTPAQSVRSLDSGGSVGKDEGKGKAGSEKKEDYEFVDDPKSGKGSANSEDSKKDNSSYVFVDEGVD